MTAEKEIKTAANSEEEKKKDEKEKKGKAKDTPKEEELSEEDKQLQDELNMVMERLSENDVTLWMPSLEIMRTLICAATTSMTSVPKPLKFLRPHYANLKTIVEKITDPNTKALCADIISVLAMTNTEGTECLQYRLMGSKDGLVEWGHEYVRHLAGEIAQEWDEIPFEGDEGKAKRAQLSALVEQIIPFQMTHNAEAEACDLLMEIEQLEMLEQHVDEAAHNRVCLYLSSCVPYVPDPENVNLLKTALSIFRKFQQWPQALRLALQINDHTLIEEVFLACRDGTMRKQLAFMLGRQQIFLELNEELEDYDDLIEIMSNTHLNNHFLSLARELDIMEPKTPEDIYKSHLDNNSRSAFGGGQVDSARQNLASSFVNGLVNAAFGQDKLLMEDGNKWLYKNKEHGMLSATASLGLLLLWDVDGGLTQIDKYLYSSEEYIKAGALLACGIVNTGVRNECDPALALLSDYVLHNSNVMRIGAILGLGLAYAGSNRDDVLSLLLPVLSHPKSSMEVVGVAALACGLVAVASCNGDVTSALLQTLMEKSEVELKDTFSRFLPLGLGLTYLGKQEAVEAVVLALEVLAEPFKSMASTMVEVCAFAGTGNVLRVQRLLHICSEHHEPQEKEDRKESKEASKKEDATVAAAAAAAAAAAGGGGAGTGAPPSSGSASGSATAASAAATATATGVQADLSSQQAVAVIGLALIGMGEDIGAEMAFRTLGHLLRYGEPCIRRAVPLALGLISVSNPRLNVLDTLSKFSHDSDSEVALNSILALGLVGAGTNNARLAAMLRQLAQYHAKDSNALFMVRLAQGLTHLGKGTLTLQPYHSERQLMNPVAVAGLLSTVVACLDVKNIILSKSHYLLYTLAASLQPRMLITFDEELRPLPVSVRVGQAVDVVGQAGKPKTITGFQTHTTPVLLAHGERAELATEDYVSLTPIMEGFVILRKKKVE